MSTTLLPRRLRVTLSVEGGSKTFTDPLDISVQGAIFGSPQSNECSITISNLNKEDRDYILSAFSVWTYGRNRGQVLVEAGRDDVGLSKVFSGVIVQSSITQPPDIGLEIQALEGYYDNLAAQNVTTRAGGSLKIAAKAVADKLGLTLQFEAEDRPVKNFSVVGNNSAMFKALEQSGVQVYQDGSKLVVKSSVSTPLDGPRLVVNKDTGMVGIPQITELGVSVQILYQPGVRVGDAIELTSVLNPSANGSYTIYDLKFALATRADRGI